MAVNPDLNNDPAYAAATAANEAARTSANYIPPSASSPGGYNTIAADQERGGVITPSTQNGSQYWMNTGYTGVEPDLSTKEAFSSADVARDWVSAYVNTLIAQGVPVNSDIQTMANSYPNVANIKTDINGKIVSIAGTLVNLSTPVNSPGSTNEPSYVTKSTSTSATTAGTGTSQPSSTAGVGDVFKSLGNYGIYLLIGIAIIFVYLLASGVGHATKHGVSA